VAARGEPAGFIFTIDCTLRASARHLASAGCRVNLNKEFKFMKKYMTDLRSLVATSW
jgi:hypothetical protein